MIYREAHIRDIKPIMRIRLAVKENRLSNPDVVTEDDCVEYMFQRGKGWVCEIDERVVGFAIVDLVEFNIWALFVDPEFERRGIGRRLHDIMLEWYFDQTLETVWLGTSPKTRAEGFYCAAGWIEAGMHGNEIKFEMPYNNWLKINF